MSISVIRFSLANMVAMYHIGIAGHVAGQISVLIFYFLSGYLVSSAYLNYAVGRYPRTRFLLNRFIRLAPLFFLVSTLTLLVLITLNGKWLDAMTFGDLRIAREFIETRESWLQLSLSNIDFRLMLDEISLGASTPIVPQGWSIVIECFFYIFLTFGATGYRKRLSIRVIVIIFSLFSGALLIRGLLTSSISEVWYQNFFATGIFYLIGGLLVHARYQQVFIKPAFFKYIYGPLFLVILAAPFGRPNSDNQTEIWIPIISTISVFLISLDILTSKNGIESTKDRFLGKMAYPIYLVHILVIGFVNLLGLALTTLTGGNQSIDSDYRNALADIVGYLTLLITWIFAAILVKFVESPLEKVRSRIRGYK